MKYLKTFEKISFQKYILIEDEDRYIKYFENVDNKQQPFFLRNDIIYISDEHYELANKYNLS